MTEQTSDIPEPENELARRRAVIENVEGFTDAVEALATYYQTLTADLGMPTAEWLELVVARLPEPYASEVRTRVAAPLLDVLARLVSGASFAEVATMMPALIGALFGHRPNEVPPHIQAMTKIGMLVGDRIGPKDPADGDGDGGAEDVPADRQRDLISSGSDGELAHARMRMVIRRLFEEAPRMTLPDGTPDPDQAPALPCHVVLRGSLPPIEGVLSTTPEGGLRLMTATPDEKGKPVLLEQFFDYADVVTVAIKREVKASPGSRIVTS